MVSIWMGATSTHVFEIVPTYFLILKTREIENNNKSKANERKQSESPLRFSSNFPYLYCLSIFTSPSSWNKYRPVCSWIIMSWASSIINNSIPRKQNIGRGSVYTPNVWVCETKTMLRVCACFVIVSVDKGNEVEGEQQSETVFWSVERRV